MHPNTAGCIAYIVDYCGQDFSESIVVQHNTNLTIQTNDGNAIYAKHLQGTHKKGGAVNTFTALHRCATMITMMMQMEMSM